MKVRQHLDSLALVQAPPVGGETSLWSRGHAPSQPLSANLPSGAASSLSALLAGRCRTSEAADPLVPNSVWSTSLLRSSCRVAAAPVGDACLAPGVSPLSFHPPFLPSAFLPSTHPSFLPSFLPLNRPSTRPLLCLNQHCGVRGHLPRCVCRCFGFGPIDAAWGGAGGAGGGGCMTHAHTHTPQDTLRLHGD